MGVVVDDEEAELVEVDPDHDAIQGVGGYGPAGVKLEVPC